MECSELHSDRWFKGMEIGVGVVCVWGGDCTFLSRVFWFFLVFLHFRIFYIPPEFLQQCVGTLVWGGGKLF